MVGTIQNYFQYLLHEFVFQEASSEPPEKFPTSLRPGDDLTNDTLLFHADRCVVQVNKLDSNLKRPKSLITP